MFVAIVPAYNPNDKLIDLLLELHRCGMGDIIVVNDGSMEETNVIFKQLSNLATVLTHDVNQGKGAAIKTAMRHILEQKKKDIQGVVILDADGQHRPEDAMVLLNKLLNNPLALVLGVRTFCGKIPLRSLFGNTVTKYVFRLCSGKWVSDTQTGLRAFSMDMIPELLAIKGERYEYEMNVLLSCAKSNKLIVEVPISTIYHDESNSCSHFRTIRDSVRIYRDILAFSGSSFLSFLLDYLLFAPFVWLFGMILTNDANLILGNIAARIVSANFNYYLNSTYVFGWRQERCKTILRYALLAAMVLGLNTVILFILHRIFGFQTMFAKLTVEILLFFLSFTVQKFWVFNKSSVELKKGHNINPAK